MGTVSMGNDDVEKKLDGVDSSIKENTSVLSGLMNTMVCNMKDSLSYLAYLNAQIKESFNTMVERSDSDKDV